MRPNHAIALACLLLLPLAAFAQEATQPDLSGSWVINEPLSETMREKIREKMEDELDNPRAQARWDRIAARDRARLETAPFSRLEIDQSNSLVTIEYLDGRVRELFTDGRGVEPNPERGEQTVTASWDLTRLIVDAETTRGRFTEFWELSEDGTRLYMTMQAEMGERFSSPVSYRQVYDEAPPEPGEPSARSGSDSD